MRPTTLANSEVPVVDKEYWKCPMPQAATVPSVPVITSWTSEQVFSWGEAAWKWGNSCAEKAVLREYYDQCVAGDKNSCTFVNQKLALQPK